MQTHISGFHNKIANFECDKCKFKCLGFGNLTRHIKVVHDRIKDVKCDKCDFKCSSNSQLKEHTKGVHDKIRDFECNECKFKCSFASGLRNHVNTVHRNIRRFECDLCGFKMATNFYLKRHKTLCTGNLKCSSGELAVMKVLDKLNIPYAYDETYDNVKDKSYLRFDFRVLADEPLFIEYDGECHFLPVRYGGISEDRAQENLESTQRRDKLKDDYCNDHGYLLLRIPYFEKDNIEVLVSEFINDNLLV